MIDDRLRDAQQVGVGGIQALGRGCGDGGEDPADRALPAALEQAIQQFGTESRRLRVVKMRGQKFQGGLHDFILDTGRVAVFPRLVASRHRSPVDHDQVGTGSIELDLMDLSGISRWFRQQADEEIVHAHKFIDHVADRDNHPRIGAVQLSIGGRTIVGPSGSPQVSLQFGSGYDPNGVPATTDLFALDQGMVVTGPMGELAPTLTDDRLHLNDDGAAAVRAVLAPVLAEQDDEDESADDATADAGDPAGS